MPTDFKAARDVTGSFLLWTDVCVGGGCVVSSTVLEQDHFCSVFLVSFATETTNSQTRDDELKAAPQWEGASTLSLGYDFEDHVKNWWRVSS